MRNLERNHCVAIIKSMEHVPWPTNKVLYTFDVNFTGDFSGKLKP